MSTHPYEHMHTHPTPMSTSERPTARVGHVVLASGSTELVSTTCQRPPVRELPGQCRLLAHTVAIFIHAGGSRHCHRYRGAT
jgi:hypothetical protein